MHLDIQKANMWKRISAALFDVILLSVIVAFLAMLFSSLLGFDTYNNALDECYNKYETKYGISFDITLDDYNAMTQQDIDLYNQAYQDFSRDEEAVFNFNVIVRLTVTIASVSILTGYLALEFIVPLFLKDGRTLGKKIFGIGVMRAHGTRVSPIALFIRTFLGKFTIETMIPVLIILMIFWGTIGIVGPLVIAGILLLQVILYFATRTHSLIHDLMAGTVVVDTASQRIFANDEERIAYSKRLAAEKAERQNY
jgi:uncharacterized RDD family membrane protein YckC